MTVPSVQRIPGAVPGRVSHRPHPAAGPGVAEPAPRRAVPPERHSRPRPPVVLSRSVRSGGTGGGAAAGRATVLEAERPVIVAGGGIKNCGGARQAPRIGRGSGSARRDVSGSRRRHSFACPLNAGQMGPRGNPVASRLVLEPTSFSRSEPVWDSTRLSTLRQHQPGRGDHPGRDRADGDRTPLSGLDRNMGGRADGSRTTDRSAAGGGRDPRSIAMDEAVFSRNGARISPAAMPKRQWTKPRFSLPACSGRFAASCPAMRRSHWTRER